MIIGLQTKPNAEGQERKNGIKNDGIGHFLVHLSNPFQSEAKCKIFVIKTIYIHIEIGTNYHNKNYALGLALKERLRETLLAILTKDDRPIKKVLPKLIITDQNCCTIKIESVPWEKHKNND